MNKLSKEKRDRLLLVCIGIAAVILVLYFFVISDMKAEIGTLHAKIVALQDKRTAAERLMQRQADLQANSEVLRAALNARQVDMPRPGQDHVWFINMMDNRRSKFNLDLVDIRNPEGWDPGILPNFPFKGVAFNVTLLGGYTDFGRFLADFENSYPYMRVQLISISPEALVNPTVRAAENAAGTDGSKLRINFRVISLIKTQT